MAEFFRQFFFIFSIDNYILWCYDIKNDMEGLNITAEQQYSYYYKNLVGRDADLISFGNYYIVTLDSIGLKDAISYKFDTLEEAISFIHNQRCC